jgi:hypothetical protein
VNGCILSHRVVNTPLMVATKKQDYKRFIERLRAAARRLASLRQTWRAGFAAAVVCVQM